MARILFVTLYDEYCLGVRQLMACLRQAGHGADLLCLKQYRKKVITDGSEPNPEWQVELMPSGLKSVLCFPFEITGRERQLVTELLQRLKPDAVGFSVYSPQIMRTLEATGIVRSALPGVPVLWGGPHATLDPAGSAQHCDFVMMGECDYSIIQFAEALDNGGDLRQIPNVCHLEDGTLVRNPIGPVPQNLDDLPFTYHGREGVYYCDDDKLEEGVPFATSDLWKTHKIMTSRGCPYACTYCMLSYQKEVMPDSTKLRYRSITHVINELAQALRDRGNYFLEIEDDIFTLRPERMEDFFEEYRRRVNMPFWCYTHPQYARDSMLTLLRENNAQFVVMGIESGSDNVANKVFNRKVNMTVVLEAAQRIKANGLRAYYDLISNNPFEAEEDRVETFHLIRRLPKPFELQLVELNFYPNIAIERMRQERGLPRKVDFESYRFWNALYHLASCIEISDADAEHYLSEPLFRTNPHFMENLASEAKRLAGALNDASLLNRNYELEIARQAKRAGDAECALAYATHRRGFSQFVTVSEALRTVKRNLQAAYGQGGGTRPAAGAASPAQGATPHGAGSQGASSREDIVVDVTAPRDFRDADVDDSRKSVQSGS
jgi:anaerobic magnesium-protoporphyrin IX monomethyl ester cyclase